MNKIYMRIFVILVFVCVQAASVAHAQSGLNQSSADRQTLLNDITDFFATRGKSAREKQQIKKERRTIRRRARLEKQRLKMEKRTQKKIKKEQSGIMRKIEEKREARENYNKKRNTEIKKELRQQDK